MTYAFHTPDKLCFILDLMNGKQAPDVWLPCELCMVLAPSRWPPDALGSVSLSHS